MDADEGAWEAAEEEEEKDWAADEEEEEEEEEEATPARIAAPLAAKESSWEAAPLEPTSSVVGFNPVPPPRKSSKGTGPLRLGRARERP